MHCRLLHTRLFLRSTQKWKWQVSSGVQTMLGATCFEHIICAFLGLLPMLLFSHVKVNQRLLCIRVSSEVLFLQWLQICRASCVTEEQPSCTPGAAEVKLLSLVLSRFTLSQHYQNSCIRGSHSALSNSSLCGNTAKDFASVRRLHRLSLCKINFKLTAGSWRLIDSSMS